MFRLGIVPVVILAEEKKIAVREVEKQGLVKNGISYREVFNVTDPYFDRRCLFDVQQISMKVR